MAVGNIGVHGERFVVDDAAFALKVDLTTWSPRLWDLKLESADAAAHLQISFNGTDVHGVLKFGAPVHWVRIPTTQRRLYAKKIAGGAGAVALIAHASDSPDF